MLYTSILSALVSAQVKNSAIESIPLTNRHGWANVRGRTLGFARTLPRTYGRILYSPIMLRFPLMPKNCGSTALCYTHSADRPGIQQEPRRYRKCSDRSFRSIGCGSLRWISNKVIVGKEYTGLRGQFIQNPCSDSRRNDGRIASYVIVIATHKLGKRTSKPVCSLTEIT